MKHATEITSTEGGKRRRPKPLAATCFLLLPMLLTLTFATCGGTTTPEAEEAATETAPAGATDAAVAYEPAYPDEVSDEGLSEEDVEQQAGEHAHADEEDHEHDGDDHEDDGEH